MSQDSVKATLYIARHGECAGNVAQMLLDPSTDLLTDVGKAQAKLFGQQFKSVPLTRAYASDFPRALETAEIILKESSQESSPSSGTTLSLKHEASLRERDYSGLIGTSASTLLSTVINAIKDGTSYLKLEVPNCEPVSQFEDRIIRFFKALIQDLRKNGKSEENILLISHGLTIQWLMVLLNNRAEEFGIQNWTPNRFSERLMRNTTHHQIELEIPRDENGIITGRVKYAHFRDHVNGESNDSSVGEAVKDKNNYTFLDNEELNNYDETTHFCKLV